MLTSWGNSMTRNLKHGRNWYRYDYLFLSFAQWIQSALWYNSIVVFFLFLYILFLCLYQKRCPTIMFYHNAQLYSLFWFIWDNGFMFVHEKDTTQYISFFLFPSISLIVLFERLKECYQLYIAESTKHIIVTFLPVLLPYC